ncbi:MAG: T9SS type A sorting domain-containing protein, partial [Crocinitomicaceae bacterium]|nr:T9SS type A sorting domain-containing protein [Crocinitomicaceae bacterium]
IGGGAQVWWIGDWEFGTTQAGSSGSPLFDQNHRIVGQLFGGLAGCAGTDPNSLYDYFGRLGVSWGLGASEHLAPVACGQALVVDGWDPNGAPEFDDASAQSISSPEVTLCALTFDPEVAIRNAGDNNLTECTLTYNIDGGTNLIYNWTGLLDPNDSEVITLPSMTSTDGAHTFNAFTSDPNATFDSNTGNDTMSKAFTLYDNSIAVFINISTDCYGYETAWDLEDAGSTIIASGGNQTVPPGGGQNANSGNPGAYGNELTITNKFCLAEGCYDFTIYDDWGDGLDGTSQAGCNTDGNYTITNDSGFIFQELQNVNFGNAEFTNFCVTVDAGLGGLTLDDFQLYPNPSSGVVNISLNSAFQNDFELEIRDLSGRLIQALELTNSMTSVDLGSVSAGTYFFTVSDGQSVLTKKVVVGG